MYAASQTTAATEHKSNGLSWHFSCLWYVQEKAEKGKVKLILLLMMLTIDASVTNPNLLVNLYRYIFSPSLIVERSLPLTPSAWRCRKSTRQ